jgi:hypothetical protein
VPFVADAVSEAGPLGVVDSLASQIHWNPRVTRVERVF